MLQERSRNAQEPVVRALGIWKFKGSPPFTGALLGEAGSSMEFTQEDASPVTLTQEEPGIYGEPGISPRISGIAGRSPRASVGG